MKTLLFMSHIPLDSSSGLIVIAADKKRIALDVGLSVNAPNSALWLAAHPERIVFGFEPNPFSMGIILSGRSTSLFPAMKNHVQKASLYESFFPLNVAVSDVETTARSFHTTDPYGNGDGGTSSLGQPLNFGRVRTVGVVSIRLDSFLRHIPWERFPYIEHLKVDAQGHDLRILQSAGHYLSERIACVSAESEAPGYSESHTPQQLRDFLLSQGFSQLQGSSNGETWLNSRFAALLQNGEIECVTEGL